MVCGNSEVGDAVVGAMNTDDLSRRCGEVSKTWKVCHAAVGEAKTFGAFPHLAIIRRLLKQFSVLHRSTEAAGK